MLETVRAWLNGTRDYKTGVALFSIVSKDKKLHATFAAGSSLNNTWRLQEEMLKICADLKAAARPVAKAPDKKKADAEIPVAQILQTAEAIQNLVTNANPELYEACRDKATAVYKDTMNKRAVLFHMIPADSYDDPNRPDLVAARRSFCLDVVRGFNEASKLYDDADNAKLYGKLEKDPCETPTENFDDIPDARVKQELDNARKNFNKVKVKEKTPARVITTQLLEHKIKILSTRWDSLKLTL